MENNCTERITAETGLEMSGDNQEQRGRVRTSLNSPHNCHGLPTAFTVEDTVVLVGTGPSSLLQRRRAASTTKVTKSYCCHTPWGRRCCCAHSKKKRLLCCFRNGTASIPKPWTHPRLQSHSCYTCSQTPASGCRATLWHPFSRSMATPHMPTSQEPGPLSLQASQHQDPTATVAL